jgi:serine/threonine protein phosphatase 1
MLFSRLLSRLRLRKPLAEASTGGALIYAVGDIHGRSDLLDLLLEKIRLDQSDLGHNQRPVLVFVGDYIDRGPDTRGVVERLLALQRSADWEVRTLEGNHEQQMLAFLDDASQGAAWVEFGGAATLASYGVSPPSARSGPAAWQEARAALKAAVAGEHMAFYRGLELAVVCGDYLFVHAGVRPGVALAAQSKADLLWIRDDFLSSSASFGKVVVHGHSPEAEPYLGNNRIGIDTGAYATSILTAVRLIDTGREIIQVRSSRRHNCLDSRQLLN